MKSPSRVLLESYSNVVGQFSCTSTSSAAIRVVTDEVRYIHALSLTLKYSMPVSSPAAPSLTSPRALHSRVLQASSTSECVFECFDCFWISTSSTEVHRVLRVVLRVLSWLHRGYEVLKPRISSIYGARCTRAPYGLAPESQIESQDQVESQISLLRIFQIFI